MTSQTCPSNLSPRVSAKWRIVRLHHSDLLGTRLRRQQSRFRVLLQWDHVFIQLDASNWDPLSTESSPYLDYHNCLLREGSEYFKYNIPNRETLDNSPAGMRTAPTGDGEVACVAENRPNATSVLSGCCGSELGVYGYGCYAWRLGGGNLQQCIDDNQELGSGTTVFCQSANDSSSERSDNDGDSSDGASRSGATRPVTSTTVLVYAVAAMLLGGTLL